MRRARRWWDLSSGRLVAWHRPTRLGRGGTLDGGGALAFAMPCRTDAAEGDRQSICIYVCRLQYLEQCRRRSLESRMFSLRYSEAGRRGQYIGAHIMHAYIPLSLHHLTNSTHSSLVTFLWRGSITFTVCHNTP